MANKYYGAAVGADMADDVAQGSASTSKPIELVVDRAAAGLDKLALLKAVEAIRLAVVQDAFPLS
jgi:hypothetical protein